VTIPTAPAAGVHLPWAQVPEPVQTWAAHVGGGAPTRVRDLRGGFSPGAAARLECPGQALFVKAVGASLNPESPVMHRRESVVSASLPDTVMFPSLLATYDDGDWVALAFEAVDGRPPRHPWERKELDSVVAALSALHDALTPSPAPQVERAASYFQSLFGGWAGLADLPEPPARLDPWARAHLSSLADLETGWPIACEGPTLVHGDVRSDNLLITRDGVVFVDWPHAAIGTPAFDLVVWAPSVVLEGGPPPEDLLAAHPQTSAADPDVVTTLLAAVCGFFVSRSFRPPPPGLPTVRAFQAAQGEVALAWLRRRTGW
jgi:aminoglycoside phosphotransferase